MAARQRTADVAIVGGGIAGSALATVLARKGVRVVVLERQRVYADRVRGEYMAEWGVEIARRLGLFDVLASAGGAMPGWAIQYDEFIPPTVAEQHRVDLGALLPGVSGVLCLPHPIACETLTQLASASGAEVVRGVEGVRLERAPGARPRLRYEVDGDVVELSCRLVVGADGRRSSVRQQANITLHRAAQTNVIAGLLVDNAPHWPQDTFALGSEGDRMFIVFPEGGDRVRLYLALTPDQRYRFAGQGGAARFLDSFRLTSMPLGAHLAEATPAGPCATLGGEDTWTDQPLADGVVLIGDAAGYNGPIIGQGLSIALRDVELVSQLLLTNAEWSPVLFEPYARDRTERMRRLRFVAALHATLFCSFSPESVQRRVGFIQRMASGDDPTLQWTVAAPLIGPYYLPEQAFDDRYLETALGGTANQGARTASH
jgi:2-polyprenyl-6-methoxyphenol hydroxylase-like FAD-dependent oxidoreductase